MVQRLHGPDALDQDEVRADLDVRRCRQPLGQAHLGAQVRRNFARIHSAGDDAEEDLVLFLIQRFPGALP